MSNSKSNQKAHRRTSTKRVYYAEALQFFLKCYLRRDVNRDDIYKIVNFHIGLTTMPKLYKFSVGIWNRPWMRRPQGRASGPVSIGIPEAVLTEWGQSHICLSNGGLDTLIVNWLDHELRSEFLTFKPRYGYDFSTACIYRPQLGDKCEVYLCYNLSGRLKMININEPKDLADRLNSSSDRSAVKIRRIRKMPDCPTEMVGAECEFEL